jgi:protein-disulfide isomerase
MGLLLEAGAAVDRVDNLGWSALMWAASRNDAVAARMLLGKGAVVGTTGRDGTTAHSLALARGADPTLLALLSTSGPAGPRPGEQATAAARASPPAVAAAKGPTLRPVVEPDRIIRGPPDAPITIVEYTDFQCPYCAAGSRTLEDLMARYGGQLRLVLKHQPLPFHPMARPAAEYFEALAMQDPDRAWAFHDRVFSGQASLAGGESHLRKLAGELGGDMPRLDRDRVGPLVRARLAADLQEAQRFQFDGVPAYVVNGRVIEGAQPMQTFVDVIEALLRQ